MCNILISIKPHYVEKILNGNKKYEYIKLKPKKNNINKMIIYSTYTQKKIVAEVKINNIIQDDKEKIWQLTKNYSGTTKEFYDESFKDKGKAIAFELGKIIIYDNLKDLSDFGVKSAPQKFIYIN